MAKTSDFESENSGSSPDAAAIDGFTPRTTKQFYLPNELWVIQTSNNPGGYDTSSEWIFIDKIDAEKEAQHWRDTRHGGREDYLVRSLDEAIYDAIREAESSAMEEG